MRAPTVLGEDTDLSGRSGAEGVSPCGPRGFSQHGVAFSGRKRSHDDGLLVPPEPKPLGAALEDVRFCTAVRSLRPSCLIILEVVELVTEV